MRRDLQSICRRDSPPLDFQKTVRFNEAENQIHTIMHRLEMTRGERHDSFFSEDEYLQMRHREKSLARHLACRIPASSFGEDGLGLETHHEKYLRKQRMKECCMSVLLEQELHRQTEGLHISDGIAEIVVEYSVYSTQLAHNRACANALEVERDQSASHLDSKAEQHHSTDRLISPSSVDALMYDCHAPCANLAIDENCAKQDNKECPDDECEKAAKTKSDADALQAEFQPPHPCIASSASPPPRILHHQSEMLMLDSVEGGAVHYYHAMPPHPWEERWAHQYSQVENAHGPVQHTRWYIAE